MSSKVIKELKPLGSWDLYPNFSFSQSGGRRWQQKREWYEEKCSCSWRNRVLATYHISQRPAEPPGENWEVWDTVPDLRAQAQGRIMWEVIQYREVLQEVAKDVSDTCVQHCAWHWEFGGEPDRPCSDSYTTNFKLCKCSESKGPCSRTQWNRTNHLKGILWVEASKITKS